MRRHAKKKFSDVADICKAKYQPWFTTACPLITEDRLQARIAKPNLEKCRDSYLSPRTRRESTGRQSHHNRASQNCQLSFGWLPCWDEVAVAYSHARDCEIVSDVVVGISSIIGSSKTNSIYLAVTWFRPAASGICYLNDGPHGWSHMAFAPRLGDTSILVEYGSVYIRCSVGNELHWRLWSWLLGSPKIWGCFGSNSVARMFPGVLLYVTCVWYCLRDLIFDSYADAQLHGIGTVPVWLLLQRPLPCFLPTILCLSSCFRLRNWGPALLGFPHFKFFSLRQDSCFLVE